MKYNIYDKEYVSKRINEILSLDYFKRFSNKEIYTAINSLGIERERLLLLPSYTEDEEKIVIYTLKQLKQIMLSNRKRNKKLSDKILLKTTIGDKGIISSEDFVSIEEVVRNNDELLKSSLKTEKFNLTILNKYIGYTEESKKEFSEKLGIDIKTLRKILNGEKAAYFQLNKVLNYFDCSTYDELIKKIDETCDFNFSLLSREYFEKNAYNNISINISIMWEVISQSDFDNTSLSIANYLFSGRKVSIEEASKLFNQPKEYISSIKNKCLNLYKEYINNPNSYVYKNVES